MGRKPKNDLQGYLFIVNHFIQRGKAPSFQAIADELGYGSKRSVTLLLKRLVAANRITYSNRKITLVHNLDMSAGERTVSVPIVGSVPCGPLGLAQENITGYIDVSTSVAKPGGTYFILRAVGDSMDRAGISPGDFMLVRQQATADDNDIVVALVDDEATVKIFRRENGYVVLRPKSNNPENKPVILSQDFIVQGKVITTLPNPY